MAILFEIGDVGDDEVDAEKLGFGEHHSGVDDDNGVADAKRHHVHAEFAETTEGYCCNGLLGVTQDACVLRSIEEESYHRAACEAFARGDANASRCVLTGFKIFQSDGRRTANA